MKKIYKRNEENMQGSYSFQNYNENVNYGDNYYIFEYKVTTKDKDKLVKKKIVVEKNEWHD